MEWNPTDYFFSYTILEIPRYIMKNAWLLGLWMLTACLYWIFSRKGIKQLWLFRYLLIETIFFILYYTLVDRPEGLEHTYNFIPFWSYKIEGGRGLNLILENIMNVLLYIPIGFFLTGGILHPKIWKVLFIGFLLSFITEVCQFFFKCGFCETDDVIHNTIGCVIGYGIYKILSTITKSV